MSHADGIAIKAWAEENWRSAVQAFAAGLRAAGVTFDAQAHAALDDELGRCVANHEHVGLTDLELLSLAHARLSPTRTAAAARCADELLARAMRPAQL